MTERRPTMRLGCDRCEYQQDYHPRDTLPICPRCGGAMVRVCVIYDTNVYGGDSLAPPGHEPRLGR